MAHPELMDELFEAVLTLIDEGKAHVSVDAERGYVIHHTSHGGQEDALPRSLLLIASCVQKFIEETGDAHWDDRYEEIGVVFHDEDQYIPLSNLGVNQRLGFYELDAHPTAVNDAGDY